MTAAEWDASHDPDKMLTAAGQRLSDRSLLLFGCAAARRVWGLLPGFATVLVPRVEAAADLPPAERAAAVSAAVEAVGGVMAAVVRARLRPERPLMAVQLAAAVLRRLEHRAPAAPQTLLGRTLALVWQSTHAANHCPEQAALLRCVAGNPFAGSRFDPAWRTSDVRALAGLADAGAFDTLPILADALQDAGCADDAMLTHLRAATTHTRGCWVLEHVAGRR